MKRGTQTWLAKSADISPGFLGDILSGRAKCPPDLAEKLDKICGVDRATWVWGSPEKLRASLDEKYPN